MTAMTFEVAPLDLEHGTRTDGLLGVDDGFWGFWMFPLLRCAGLGFVGLRDGSGALVKTR